MFTVTKKRHKLCGHEGDRISIQRFPKILQQPTKAEVRSHVVAFLYNTGFAKYGYCFIIRLQYRLNHVRTILVSKVARDLLYIIQQSTFKISLMYIRCMVSFKCTV